SGRGTEGFSGCEAGVGALGAGPGVGGVTAGAGAALGLVMRSMSDIWPAWVRGVGMPRPKLLKVKSAARVGGARVDALSEARPGRKLVEERPESPMPSDALRCIRMIPIRKTVIMT